jgi:hypothetical protein
LSPDEAAARLRALGFDGAAVAVLLVARPEADPVPAFRELAGGVRRPGDR